MSPFEAFGLERDPFGTAPDPAMFYRTLGHEDCYERLKLAIQLERGLSVVIGDAGYGKTTIRAALLQEVERDEAFAIGIIADPRDCRTDVQFLRAILGQFGLSASGRTGLDLTTEFLAYLDRMRAARRRVLLVIDEGQHLSSSHLEIVRTFVSFETPGQRLISVVIFAEPDLEEKIARKRNLAQRIGMDHRLNPLNRRDSAGLIAHRLRVAGRPADAPALFTPEAVDAIYEQSRGIPRAITRLCAALLAEAGARGQQQVDGSLAEQVIGRGVEGTEAGRRLHPIQAALPFRMAPAGEATT